MNYLLNATDFLVQTILNLALYTILLRFWMQWVRADFRNQIGQFIITVTNPVVLPLRKIIPSIGTVDTATLLLAYAIATLKVYSLLSLRGIDVDVINLVIFGVGQLLQASVYLFFVAIFIQVIASWVSPGSYHPVLNVARAISEPIMAPARKLIPAVGGIDFSPLVVIIFLQLTLRLIVAPLLPYGL